REPCQLQAAPGERAALDLATVEIFDDALPGAPAEGEIRVPSRRPIGIIDINQIVGAAVQRKTKLVRPFERRRRHRLVEAGDQPLVAGSLCDQEGNEMALEKGPRLSGRGLPGAARLLEDR